MSGPIEPVKIEQTTTGHYEVRNADGSLFLLAGPTHGAWIEQLLKDRAEVAALTKDAERYRLLRDAERGDWFWSIYEDDGNGGLQLKSGADLDAALAAKEGT